MVGVVVVASTWNASFTQSSRLWAAVAALVIAALVGLSALPVRTAIRTPGILPIAITSAAIAIYACVPETDQMRPVGLTVAGLAIVELAIRRPLPVVWHASAGTLVMWSGLYGATGRQSALVGALFACLPILTLAGWLKVRPALTTCHEGWRWVILGVGCLICVGMARTGGISMSTETAVRWTLLWGAALICSTGLVAWIST
jgi:hypothetical protein